MAVTGTVSVAHADTAYGNIVSNDAPVQTEVATDTEAVVRKYFSDIPVMIQIARCESSFRQTLPDGSVVRGKVDPRDVGVMQINTGYHGAEAKKLGLDLTKLRDNMAFARYLYEKHGTAPWNASRSCWSQTLASR